MQDVETLIKIIIPVILLIFWALSNLLNRENKQAAEKERTSGLSNRPTAYQPPRPPAPRRAPAPPPRYVPSNEEVMIIRAEPNRSQGRPPQPAKRNAGRGRGGQNVQGRRAEPPPAARNRDLLGGNVAADMNHSLSRPIELHPLTQTMASAGSQNSTASTASVDVLSATNAPALLLALLDPVRVREAFVLNEILQPPVSRRGAAARAVHLRSSASDQH
jgi:hypothetical protein